MYRRRAFICVHPRSFAAAKRYNIIMSSARVCLAWFACWSALALAQTASITGAITDPDGGPVKDARVEAKNSATGAVVRAASSPKGEYTLALPAGTYDLAVPMPCCQWGSFAQASIVLRAGE